MDPGPWTSHAARAVEAARLGAEVLRKWRGRFQVRQKAPFDLVTDADVECQQTVCAHLERLFPGYGFIGEEDVNRSSSQADGLYWIIDPIDGTTNFVHGLPGYCISIALQAANELVVGVILDPSRNELFLAGHGQGAWLDQQRLTTSSIDQLENAVIGIEAPYGAAARAETLKSWNYLAMRAQGMRETGSTALDLANIAAGRLDGYWGGFENHLWDVAAGIVLIREAGGNVTNPDGRDWDPRQEAIVASNGPLHRHLVKILRQKNGGECRV